MIAPTRALAGLLCLCFACAAGAGIRSDAETRKIIDEIEDLSTDLDASREFAHLNAGDKQKIRDAGQHMRDLVEPVSRLDELSQAQRVEFDTTLADLNHRLAEAELDRPRCQPERVTGSNRRVMVCRTKREEQAQRDAAFRALSKPRGCTGETCGRN